MTNMRTSITIAAIVMLLTGCSATTAESGQVTVSPAPVTASPTPTSAAQGLAAIKDETVKMTPEQQDTAFLAGVRTSVTTGTDAALIATGRKVCADVAAGLEMSERAKNVVAAGYPSSVALNIMVVAGLVYCKA